MLKIKGLRYTAGNATILENINAEFRPGEFNIILGPNGSGKSSLLRAVCGEINDYTGSVYYNDIAVTLLKKSELAKSRAVLRQSPDLHFPLTVEEVVMMGRYPHFQLRPTRNDERICTEVMSRLQLLAFRERNYLTLSGGEKQRVHFARTLAQIWETRSNEMRYLFLDEPLTGLDIGYQHEFLHMAGELLNRDTILISVIHDLNLALQYADNLFFLKQGKLAAQGNPASILTEELIEMVFGVQTSLIHNQVTRFPLVAYHNRAGSD